MSSSPKGSHFLPGGRLVAAKNAARGDTFPREQIHNHCAIALQDIVRTLGLCLGPLEYRDITSEGLLRQGSFKGRSKGNIPKGWKQPLDSLKCAASGRFVFLVA